MHALLLQMALIPLTMSRFSIAALSDSVLNRFVPMNRAVRMHIHLGYTLVILAFLSTVVFFIFFGTLCSDGEDPFCAKFRTQIMSTGYAILFTLLVIGGTAYFRYSMPYEVFYAIHHLVFALYAINIAHTLDDVHRDNERNRSQTFKWFSIPL
jgi:NADH:ubiquinone oxidoreductase subunit H